MKKSELIELILTYYVDKLQVYTVKELKQILADVEKNKISI